VGNHLGIKLLRQNSSWPTDRWHDRALIQYIYEQMDARRRSFIARRLVCIGAIVIASIAGLIIWQISFLIGLAIFTIATLSIVNYYQNNLSGYFSDRYGYELDAVENSIGDITEAEAAEYAEIIMTRREIELLSKRLHAISRNNFLFVDTNNHHDQK
jgi:hypothetical protein